MKPITKILLSTAVTLIPLGIFAQEKFEEHNGFNSQGSKAYKHLDNKKSFSKQFLINKGINYSFEGKLETKPKSGLNGTWIIDGIKVLVDDKTFIRQSQKIIKVGDTIEVKAKRIDNKITAVLLDQEDGFFN